jgi:hypothetical protein
LDLRTLSSSLLILLLIVIFLALPSPATASGVVDQSYAPSTSNWNWINLHMPIGQSFTPTKNSLVGIDVGIDNVLVIDQSYNPGFAGATWNWINPHEPIGQSFVPTMPILGGVDVGIQQLAQLDQSFDPGFGASGVGWNWVQAHQPIGQSFTPAFPRLWYVELGLDNPSAGPVSLTLNVRQGTISGPIVGTASLTVPVTGSNNPKFFSAVFLPFPGVPVTPGMTYVLDLVGSGSDTVQWYVQSGGTYPGGTAIEGGAPDSSQDYIFRTYGLGDNLSMKIHTGAISGPVLATRTLPIPPMDFPIMMNFNLTTPITVTPGTTYVIELQQSYQTVRWYLVSSGGYPPGTAITGGTPQSGSDYLFDTYGAGDSLTVNIRAGSIGGSVLATATGSVPLTSPTLVHVDFSSMALTPGNLYVIELQESVQSMRWYIVDPGGAYVGGTAINSGVIDSSGDYVFNTYAASSPTSTSLAVTFTPPTVDIGTHPPGSGIITATISPAVAGLPISIYFGTSTAGPWTLISTGPTDGSGQYTVPWTPPTTGTYYFRADFAGDSSYSPSTTTSTPSSMVVIPEFPPAAVGIILMLCIGLFELHWHSRKQPT